MARKLIKRFIPDTEWIKRQKSLSLFGSWLHDPNLWHLNRHSAASAAFIGLFVAFIPLPLQMPIAALLSVMFRSNLAIAVTLVWVTNPLTIAPMFYLAYEVGAVVLGSPTSSFEFDLTWHWLSEGLSQHWQPFLLGCFLCGLFFGLLASTAIRILWRYHTIARWRERRLKRQP